MVAAKRKRSDHTPRLTPNLGVIPARVAGIHFTASANVAKV